MKAIGLAAVLCCAFVVPFIDYYSSHDLLVKHSVPDASSRALEPAKLLAPFQRFAGVSLPLGAPLADEMPLGCGWAVLSAIPLVVYQFVSRTHRGPQDKRAFRWTVFLLVMSCLLLFATTFLFPWDYSGVLSFPISLLKTIQFPWRLIGVATFYLLLLLGLFMARQIKPRRLQEDTVVILICAFALVEAGFATSSFVENAGRLSIESLLTEQTNIVIGEYLPTELNTEYFVEWNGDYTPRKSSEDVVIDSYERVTPQRSVVTLRNESASEERVRLPLLWHAELSAQGTDESGAATTLNIERDSGYAALIVAPGFAGTITVEFVEPLTWRIAEGVSIAGALLLVVWLVLRTLRQHPHSKQHAAHAERDEYSNNNPSTDWPHK